MKDLPLLTTKFQIPMPHGELLPRPALLDKLNNARSLTVLAAPPGYGKTSLLATWALYAKRKIVWLAFDATDNAPDRFWQTIHNALSVTIPDFPHVGEPFAEQLCNALQTTPPLTVIFDNFHVLDNPNLHKEVIFLIEHLPTQNKLFLSSHLPPPLPLSRWRARGNLTELTYTDLALSPSELQETISHESPQTLYEKTEGWLAGIQIANTLSADQILGYHPHFIQYFEEEVIPLIPLAVREIIQNISILPSITPEIGEVLTGLPANEINLILQNTPFVFADKPLTYHIHPLFRDYLLDQLQHRDSALAVELHRRAWHYLEPDPEQALPHALAAQDPETAARLLSRVAQNLLITGRWTQLRQWLEQIPEPLIETYPRLWLTRTWLTLETYRQDTIQPYLERFDHLLAQNPAPSFQSELFAMRAIVAAMQNQPNEASQHAHQAEAHWPEGDPSAGAYIAFALGGAYKMAGAIFQAEHWFRQTLALAETSQNAYLAFSAHENLSDMLYQQARLQEAHLHALRAIKYATVEGIEAPFTGWARNILGLVALVWNELDAAQTEAERSIEICKKWGNAVIQAYALVLLSQTYQIRGDYSQATHWLEQADTLARQTGDPRFMRIVLRQRVLLSLTENNPDAARRWWTTLNNLSTDDSIPTKYHHALLAARLQLTEGQPSHSLKILSKAAETFEDTHFALIDLERYLLTALTYRALGIPDEAAKSLEKALHIAAPSKIQQPFLQAGAPMRELLRRLAAHSIHAVFIGILLTTFGENNADTSDLALTNRETQILRLLAAGFSNRDVAEELFIAESTLKRHIANLYLKMGVHSRTQAIARAQEYHLL